LTISPAGKRGTPTLELVVRKLFGWFAGLSPRGRWYLWSLCMIGWTVSLLTPYPVRVGHEVLSEQAAFPIAKGLHMSVYAGLTALSAWLFVPRSRRWLLLALLSLHGFATEYLQTFVPARTGCWQDVGLDHIGITVGFLVSVRWWLARDEGSTAAASPSIQRQAA
jgi:VanZ family protein